MTRSRKAVKRALLSELYPGATVGVHRLSQACIEAVGMLADEISIRVMT
jgi:hypothetical protein